MQISVKILWMFNLVGKLLIYLDLLPLYFHGQGRFRSGWDGTSAISLFRKIEGNWLSDLIMCIILQEEIKLVWEKSAQNLWKYVCCCYYWIMYFWHFFLNQACQEQHGQHLAACYIQIVPRDIQLIAWCQGGRNSGNHQRAWGQKFASQNHCTETS